jgi:hypothetical protein
VLGDISFFLDRGVGSRILATGLREAAWSITTMDERYGADVSQNVADPDWIRESSAHNEILISKDRAIAKRPLEAEAIFYSDARALVITSGQITGIEMLAWLLSNESAIGALASRSGPWVFGVYRDRIAPIRINYPSAR